MSDGGTPRRPTRGRIPWELIAALFVPAIAVIAWWARGLEGFRFAHPWALLMIPIAAALIIWAGIVRRPARTGTLVYSRAAELARQPRGLVARVRDLPIVLRLAAVALIGLAIARPQTSRPDRDLDLEGIDIVLALDVSGSMQETDLAPNRLQAAKHVIERFVRQRPYDRIGLVVFGRDAFTYVPLTLDHGTFLRMLGELQVGIIDGGATAIGNGLGVALGRLRRSDARSKVVILLTDGDNNSGNIAPLEAARFAQTLGVKVYTILAGDNDNAPAQAGMALTGHRYATNPKLLEQIASMTGGIPYLAVDTRALQQRFQSILEELEKSRIKDRGVLYAELYRKFLFPAFILLALELVLRLTRLNRLP